MNLDELAEQIGSAVMDRIEQERRINKRDLVEAAYLTLKRWSETRRLDTERAFAAFMQNMPPDAPVNIREPHEMPAPSKLPRVYSADGRRRYTMEEWARKLPDAYVKGEAPIKRVRCWDGKLP